MFDINDVVVYSSFGVCRIVDISVKDFCGSPARYYVLEPVFDDRCTYFVDVANQLAISRLHPVLAPAAARELIASLPKIEEQWDDNPKERKALFSRIVSGGDRLELIGLIKALRSYERSQRAAGKKLNMSDEQSLRLAEKLIRQELAVSLDLPPEQVEPYICGVLQRQAAQDPA